MLEIRRAALLQGGRETRSLDPMRVAGGRTPENAYDRPMGGPTTPGNIDGESIDAGDRTWTWDSLTSSWRPSVPRPFEVVVSLASPPVSLYWEPILAEWLPVTTVVKGGDGPAETVVFRIHDDEGSE